jgi:hypothetical protein
LVEVEGATVVLVVEVVVEANVIPSFAKRAASTELIDLVVVVI